MNKRLIVSINTETTKLLNKLSDYCNTYHIILRVEILDKMYVIEVSSHTEDKFIDHVINNLKEADTNGRH